MQIDTFTSDNQITFWNINDRSAGDTCRTAVHDYDLKFEI